jgi:surface antigen
MKWRTDAGSTIPTGAMRENWTLVQHQRRMRTPQDVLLKVSAAALKTNSCSVVNPRIVAPVVFSSRRGTMKRTSTYCLAWIAVIGITFSGSVLAFNALFMSKGPLSHLTKSDIKIARAEIGAALETAPDGHTHTWSNPETKASGTVTPIKTFTMKGMNCRLMEFTSYVGGERGQSKWNLCKTKDGWKIATGE